MEAMHTEKRLSLIHISGTVQSIFSACCGCNDRKDCISRISDPVVLPGKGIYFAGGIYSLSLIHIFEEQERGVDHLEQEVQQAVNTLDNYRQYFTDYMPELTKFGLKVVAAILIFIGGRKVIQWIIYLIKASMEKASVDKGVVQFIGSLLRVCLYILLVFTIATHFGVKESSVAALLGTAGVTVGLALQGGLANIAGGILLLTFKPFQVGDYIIIAQQNGCEGTVYKIEICYTTLISIDNKHIVIPNGTLSSSIITNVTARDLRKLEIKVGISYDADIHKAKELLEDILHNDEDTKDDKGMVVFVDAVSYTHLDVYKRQTLQCE